MRITAELLSTVEQRVNPNNQRELVLRELAIPAIENMGAALDQYDCFDFSNNRLTRLENFPRLLRLSELVCAGNAIESVDVKNLCKNLPNLVALTLSHNSMTSLSQVMELGQACPKLEFLSLVGNPVTNRQHYRLYTIHQFPQLRVLDYIKIKPTERDRAQRLATSAAGAALNQDVAAQKTFEPGESTDGARAVVVFSLEEKEHIRNLLQNAKSASEIEDIEAAVRRGVLPAALTNNKKRDLSPTIASRVTDDEQQLQPQSPVSKKAKVED